MTRSSRMFTTTVLAGLIAAPAFAGGAWAPAPGKGYAYLGYSRKTANSSWDAFGEGFTHRNAAGEEVWHDFRYLYLSGEVGILKGLSLYLTGTWLYGLEGPKSDYDKNVGLSDAWLGFKYQVARKSWPMAVAFNHRSPYFYDLPGPYNRDLFNSRGQVIGSSPEWRGLLKYDLSLSCLVSRSFHDYRAWANMEAGYTWRTGAPADQVFYVGEVGYPLPFLASYVKGAVFGQWSVGSDSPRQPDDRFGSRDDYNFNKASYAKLGASWIVPFGKNHEWSAEVGYNQWIRGRSARQYNEPYLSLGRKF